MCKLIKIAWHKGTEYRGTGVQRHRGNEYGEVRKLDIFGIFEHRLILKRAHPVRAGATVTLIDSLSVSQPLTPRHT